jgi:hypothetical protein
MAVVYLWREYGEDQSTDRRERRRVTAAARSYPRDVQAARRERRVAFGVVQACAEFHARYKLLCLPGGWDDGFYGRILEGEPDAVERALCFLEVRPYFFRSGYMWKDILQKCKRAPMGVEHAARFAALLERIREWKAVRQGQSERGRSVRTNLMTLLSRCGDIFRVYLPDGKLDGLVTVGDLYALLCAELKIEAKDKPDERSGRVWPYQPAWDHTSRQWSAEDVWTTLVATIREVHRLDVSSHLDRETIFSPAAEESVPPDEWLRGSKTSSTRIN